MAVDKLVDSTQLDADLTSVANAIRTKGGTSASLTFPAGFVSAVEAIPTGGGGGSFVKHTGSVTFSSNTQNFSVTGLGAPAMIVLFAIHDAPTNAYDGTSKTLAHIYADGTCTVISTNNAGTANAARVATSIQNWLNGRTVSPDNTNASKGQIIATETGFSVSAYTGFLYKAGYTYDWICWTYPED